MGREYLYEIRLRSAWHQAWPAARTQKKKKIGINHTQDPIMYRIKYQADLFLCKDEKTVKSLASHPPSGPTALLTSHHHDDLNGVSPIPRDSSALPPH